MTDHANADTATVRFGGTARFAICDLLGQDTDLANHIDEYGIMEPVPFTLSELHTLRGTFQDSGLTHTNVLTAMMRIHSAICDLGGTPR